MPSTTTPSMLVAELLMDLGNRCPDDPAPDMQVFVIATADFDPDGWRFAFHRVSAPANLLHAYKLTAEATDRYTSHRTAAAQRLMWDIVTDYVVATEQMSSYEEDTAQYVGAEEFCTKVAVLMDADDRRRWRDNRYFSTNVNPFVLGELA